MAKLQRISLNLASLLPVPSPDRLLAVGLLAFHFGMANAPNKPETDIAAGEGAFTDGRVVRIDTLATSADGVENVVGIEKQRQTAVEKVGAEAAIDSEIRVNFGQQGLCAAAVVGVGKDL